LARRTQIHVKIKGLDKVLKELNRFGERGRRAFAAGLYVEGQEIMTESKRECPVDTGTLRGTGHVEKPKFKGRSISVTLGYGGPAAPYAIYVHERTELSHATGKAKYLEDPAKGAATGMAGRVGQFVKKRLGV